ncbi:MAG: serine hydrolase domain-containing protein [Pseudomonadota bacterium]
MKIDRRHLLVAGGALSAAAISDANASRSHAEPGWNALSDAMAAFFPTPNEDYTTGGVVLAQLGDSLIFSGAYGDANREWNIKWTPDTSYWTASIAKSFAAQIALYLCNEGLLSLEAPVNEYIDEFPLYNPPVRLWHVLSMRTGLWEYADGLVMSGVAYGAFGTGMTKAEMLDFVTAQPTTMFEPGTTKIRYEDVSYMLLDIILERVTQKTFPELLQQYIAQPLGLKRTKAPKQNHFWSLPERSATAYSSEGGHEGGHDAPWIETENPFTYGHASGIISTTPRDLLKWVDASARKMTGPTSLKRLAEPEMLQNFPESRYGYGVRKKWHRGFRVISHEGYVGNHYSYTPALDLSLVIMTNERKRFSAHTIAETALETVINTVEKSKVDISPTDASSEFREDKRRERYWKLNAAWLNERTRETKKALKHFFLERENGCVIAAYNDDDGVLRHSFLGVDFSLRPIDASNFSVVVGGDTAKATLTDQGLMVEGHGFNKPTLFVRTAPIRASNIEDLAGAYYCAPWRALFWIEQTKAGAWRFRNSDRSANGRWPVNALTKDTLLMGTPETGDFFSARALYANDRKMASGLVLNTAYARGVRMHRVDLSDHTPR